MTVSGLIKLIEDNWKEISGVGLAGWLSFKGIFRTYKAYKKKVQPVKDWIKKMEDAAGLVPALSSDLAEVKKKLEVNGGSTPADAIYEIRNDVRVLKSRQDSSIKLSREAMFENDADGNCVTANDSLCELFEAKEEDMLGNGWTDFVADRDRVYERWVEKLKHNDKINDEYTIMPGKTKDTKKWIICKYVAIVNRDKDGEVINVTGKVSKLYQ